MMTVDQVMDEIKGYANDGVKKLLLKHGAQEPIYGVKISDLKKIQKKIKKDYQLALDLYATGVSDAMYLAGLIADDIKMTKNDLNNWVSNAHWSMLSEYTVPWVAAESNYGYVLAKEWMKSKNENIAVAGWVTYSCLLMLWPDEQIDKSEVKKLVEQVKKEIAHAPNRVKQTMNMFVITVGGYIPDLTEWAIKIGTEIGLIKVDMGDTACKTPSIPQYIEKMKLRGNIGKKRKTVKC
jgi:3-methyladenine DNA glycosylase AlkD